MIEKAPKFLVCGIGQNGRVQLEENCPDRTTADSTCQFLRDFLKVPVVAYRLCDPAELRPPFFSQETGPEGVAFNVPTSLNAPGIEMTPVNDTISGGTDATAIEESKRAAGLLPGTASDSVNEGSHSPSNSRTSKGVSDSQVEGLDELDAPRRLKRIAEIIEAVHQRAMACDGPVAETLSVMVQSDISAIYALARGKPEDWRPHDDI